MNKHIFMSIAAAGVLGVTAAAWAMPGPNYCDGPMGGMGMRGAKSDRIDPAAFAEQRLARLRTDLKVTPEQEPLWQAFAEKTKAEAGRGWQAMRETAQDLSLAAPERMARMAGIMKERVAAMEAVNESFKRLYDALTPEQKRVADIHAARMAGAGRMHGHRGPMPPMGATPPAPPAPPAR